MGSSRSRVKSQLNIKVKLQAEISIYHHLPKDWENFSLNDALDSRNSMQVTENTTTGIIIMGSRMVSQINDTTILRH
jgi:hypothetical protein